MAKVHVPGIAGLTITPTNGSIGDINLIPVAGVRDNNQGTPEVEGRWLA